MKSQLGKALKIFGLFTVITGVVYPLIVTLFAQTLFNQKANGSLLVKDGKIIGSEIIGQKFDSTAFFWSRPSAVDYNPIPSGGSNLGPTSMQMATLVHQRDIFFRAANHIAVIQKVPVDMLTASASGLDPHISPRAAYLQVDRIANARDLNSLQKQQLVKLINKHTENLQFSFLGEERVNVLLLNLELDKY
jgi:potassium-transporting ATPase KdpC subunit